MRRNWQVKKPTSCEKTKLLVTIVIIFLLMLSISTVSIAEDYDSGQKFPSLRQWLERRNDVKQEKTLKWQEKNSKQFVLFGRDTPLPSDYGIQPQKCLVKKITKMGRGSQPDWSWDGKLITYIDKINDNYEIFVMNADGSNRRCITNNIKVPYKFKNKHKGKPTFYPLDSRYLLFSVENEHGDHSLKTQPGIGDNHDFWLTDLKRERYWRLTKFPKDSAIQYPRFSSDGLKLLWSQRYKKDKGAILEYGYEYGFWKLRLANFVIDINNPELTSIVDLEPGGRGYYEPHGFLPRDNNKIIMTAQTKPEKSAFYLDICTYDLISKEFVNLVSTDDIHYEMALYSPNGQKISYMAGPFIGFLKGPHKTDLFLMDSNGSNRVRLTYFNDPGHKDYVGATVQIQKESWSPDGRQMISAYYNHKTKESILFKIDFAGFCGD